MRYTVLEVIHADAFALGGLVARLHRRESSASTRASMRGNPYFAFGRRPFREARLRAYIVRQHRAGRRLSEILEDRYVRRCGSESFCWAVLQDPTTIEALERNIREAFADERLRVLGPAEEPG